VKKLGPKAEVSAINSHGLLLRKEGSGRVRVLKDWRRRNQKQWRQISEPRHIQTTLSLE
jgi:hypothetical protein